jgi:alpha-ribazole phosphatase
VSVTTYVDLIRHGEPVGGHRYRGQLDDPLSETGWQQMMSAVDGYQTWQAIVTSPLRRCHEFALVLGKKLNIPVQDETRFKEIGFGAWEGRTVEELRQSDPESLARFYLDPISHRPAGAEDSHAFIDRVNNAWQELLAAKAGRHVLVVAHAGVIRAIIGQVLEMPMTNMFRLQIDNASVSRIRIEVDRPPTLVFHNGHL